MSIRIPEGVEAAVLADTIGLTARGNRNGLNSGRGPE